MKARPLREVILTLKTFNPVILAKAGIHLNDWLKWIPAFAGMTEFNVFVGNWALFLFEQSSHVILYLAYKLIRTSAHLLIHSVSFKPSLPRRRESKLSFKLKMDSHLRVNDGFSVYSNQISVAMRPVALSRRKEKNFSLSVKVHQFSLCPPP